MSWRTISTRPTGRQSGPWGGGETPAICASTREAPTSTAARSRGRGLPSMTFSWYRSAGGRTHDGPSPGARTGAGARQPFPGATARASRTVGREPGRPAGGPGRTTAGRRDRSRRVSWTSWPGPPSGASWPPPVPRYFGFVIGGSLPGGARRRLAGCDLGPERRHLRDVAAAVGVEDVAGEWLLDLFDLPRESGVGFVTGCQMANFTGLAAARHGVLRRAGWDVEADGLAGAPRASTSSPRRESHVTIDVAMRYPRPRHARAPARGDRRAGAHARRPPARRAGRAWTARRSSAPRPAT